MKHNTLKRVLAGSLALLTVASPMTANVGGILQEFAIVANAAQFDPLTVNWGYHLYPYLNDVTVGTDTSFSGLTSAAPEIRYTKGQGATAVITSRVPLTKSISNGEDAEKVAAKEAAQNALYNGEDGLAAWYDDNKSTLDVFTLKTDTDGVAVNVDYYDHDESENKTGSGFWVRKPYDELSSSEKNYVNSHLYEDYVAWRGSSKLSDGEGVYKYSFSTKYPEPGQFLNGRAKDTNNDYATISAAKKYQTKEYYKQVEFADLSDAQKLVVSEACQSIASQDTKVDSSFKGDYQDVTAESKEQNFKGLKPGQFTVSKSDDNVWTYTIATKTDKGTGVADTLALAGDTASVRFAFNANGVVDSETNLSNYNVSMQCVLSDKDDTIGTLTEATELELTQNTQAILSSKNNFKVEVRDKANGQYFETVPSKYDATKKQYTATITVPVTDQSVELTVVALNKAALTYTANANILTVNGETVEQDQEAASIKASAYRAEVRGERDQLIDEEIDEKEFAFGSEIAYGEGAKDGVTVLLTRDSELTTSRDNSEGTPNVMLTIKKDGAVWAGIENMYFKGSKEQRWTLCDGSGTEISEAAYNATASSDHTYAMYTKTSATTAEREVPLTYSELMSLFEDATTGSSSDQQGFRFTQAGNYEISARFFTEKYDDTSSTTGSDDQNVRYKFSISPLQVVATDLTFQLVDANGDPVTGVTPQPVSFDGNGAVQIEVPDKFQGKTFYVEIKPNQNSKKYKNLADFELVQYNNIPTTLADGFRRYYVDGELTVTKLNKTVPVSFDIYDQNYGATLDSNNNNKPKVIELSYTLVAAAQKPEITLVDDPEDVVSSSGFYLSTPNEGVLRIAQCDTTNAKFREIFWNNYKGNAFVEEHKEEITFGYLPVMGKSYKDDYLSQIKSGFPTVADQDGYTLFAMYEGRPFWSGDVMVVNHKATLRMKKEALNLTYGDPINLEAYELVDENGNVMTDTKLDELGIYDIWYAADSDSQKTSGRQNGVQWYLNPDGTYAKTERVYVNEDGFTWDQDLDIGNKQFPDENSYLNAGTYVVEYDPYYDYYNADFTVDADEFIMVIDKREISDEMFFVKDKNYNGKDQRRNSVQFRWADKNEDNKIVREITSDNATKDNDVYPEVNRDIWVTVTDGQEHGKNVAKYQLDLKANELDAYVDPITCFTGNYTSTATTYWCISPIESTDYLKPDARRNITPGFKWNTTNTSLYDNGRIHVDYSIYDVNNMNLPDGVTLVDYGVVGCKSDQLAAPTRANGKKLTVEEYERQKKGGADTRAVISEDVLNEVRSQLTYKGLKSRNETSYGNGFFEGHVSEKNRADKIYGANISVLDAETGEWVLPYALYSDGTIVYDQYPIYLDLTMEATRVLQLKLNPEYYLDRNKGKFIAGYDEDLNKYEGYAYYKEIDTAKVKAKVNDFGVVVARDGQFDRNGISLIDGKTTVSDGLKLNKKDRYGLVIGHNNKEAGAVLKQEEYGANITVGSNDQGVWLNAYLDLGNGLVVYTAPEYYEPVSDYYGGFGQAVSVDVRGAITKDGIVAFQDPNAAFDLEDLNGTAVLGNDDTPHNPRIEVNGVEEVNGLGKIAKPGTVTTTFSAPQNQYTFKFTNTVLNNNPNYKFVENGVVVCNDESLISRISGTLPNGTPVTVYRLKNDAASKLVLNNGYVEGYHNADGSLPEYTGNINGNGTKIQVVRAWQKFKTDEGNTVTVYGDITMNYFGTPLDENSIIVNGEVRDFRDMRD